MQAGHDSQNVMRGCDKTSLLDCLIEHVMRERVRAFVGLPEIVVAQQVFVVAGEILQGYYFLVRISPQAKGKFGLEFLALFRCYGRDVVKLEPMQNYVDNQGENDNEVYGEAPEFGPSRLILGRNKTLECRQRDRQRTDGSDDQRHEC